MKLLKDAQTRSAVRSVLKVVGAIAATYFGLDEVAVSQVVDAVATIGGAVSVLAGVYLSWKDKRAE
jgi:hypothetical protein